MGTSLAIIKERQQAAIKEMNPELKKVYKAIKSKTEQVKKNAVMAMYEVGEHVKAVTANERRYGEAAVPTLAVALGKQWSQNQLWDYRALANAWTRAGIEKLVGQSTAGGNPITLTHLKKLSGLEADMRKEMTRRVFVEDLTTDELADAIKEASGGKTRSSGGRPVTPPKSITSGLNQIAKYPAEIGKRVKIWDTHVFNKIDKASPEECDEDLLKQLRETKKAEEQAIKNSEHIVGRIDKAINRVETVMAKRETVKKEAAPKAGANGHATKKVPKKKVAKKKTAKKKGPVSAKDRIAAAKKKRGRPAAT